MSSVVFGGGDSSAFFIYCQYLLEVGKILHFVTLALCNFMVRHFFEPGGD